MFTLQLFTEILVVGALLLLGTLPVLLFLDRQSLLKGRVLPFIDHFDSNLPITFVLLVVAYAVGAAGNRLIDSLWDEIPSPRDEHSIFKPGWKTNEDFYNDELIASLAAESPTQQQHAASSVNGNPPGSDRIRCDKTIVKEVNCIKAAEFALRERSAATREWLDNRRTYIRIMRTSSFSALLLIASMFVYNLRTRGLRERESREDNRPPDLMLMMVPGDIHTSVPGPLRHHHYRRVHFIAAAILLVAFASANHIADEKYWKRVYELYLTLPPPAKAA
jgi:hypothetical protein